MNSSLLLTLLMIYWISDVSVAQKFTAISGFLCIDTNFVEIVANHENKDGEIFCALTCSQRFNCQAFITADGDCKLFVFDKCSKSVRSSCNCTRRGQVFIKQQAGLDEGSLCSSGYGDELCGVKYRLSQTSAVWSQHLAWSQQESGLVIMADVTDSNELAHIKSLNRNTGYYLGGYQRAGSAEPAGGWYWVACNLTINQSMPSFWAPDEPNNMNNENAVLKPTSDQGLFDSLESAPNRCLFECVSPFN